MSDPMNSALENIAEPIVPNWLKNSTAVLFLILFVAFSLVLVLHIKSADDKEWGRYLVIFNVVQAFGAASVGALLGTTIKSQQVKNAQDKAQAATEKADQTIKNVQDKKEAAEQRISETERKGIVLRDAIQRALERSTKSPNKVFLPSRPVRKERTGGAEMYIADLQGQSPSHWVVEKGEIQEVDPELSELAKLSADLFR